MSDFDVRKVGGRIGAEVLGVDVRHLSDAQTAQIRAALLEHKALVFRGQELTDDDQTAFASRFGPLTGAHPTVPSVEGQPQVLPVDGEQGIRANHWHTDVTFIRTPPRLSTLRGIITTAYGGNTLIANSATAYQDLPGELREFADRLWAEHTNDYDYALPRHSGENGDNGDNGDKAAAYRKVFLSTKYRTAHPVVRVHPESGQRGLFIGGFAQKIVGL